MIKPPEITSIKLFIPLDTSIISTSINPMASTINTNAIPNKIVETAIILLQILYVFKDNFTLLFYKLAKYIINIKVNIIAKTSNTNIISPKPKFFIK
jgi:hypothetical protein